MEKKREKEMEELGLFYVPVCMPTNTLQLLNVAASTIPVDKEWDSNIKSTCLISTGLDKKSRNDVDFISGMSWL